MRKNFNLILAGAVTLLTLAFIIIISTVDVGIVSIPSKGITYKLGLYSTNSRFNNAIGYNEAFFFVSEFLGYFSIACGSVFAVIGLVQWIKRKSLFKVDAKIIALGILWVIMAGIYVLFLLKPVNYRPAPIPFLKDGESSFPSSHSLLAIVVFGGICLVVGDYVKNPKLVLSIKITCMLLAIASMLFRLFSGVHWLTDIIAGCLFAASMLSIFKVVLDLIEIKKQIKKEETK